MVGYFINWDFFIEWDSLAYTKKVLNLLGPYKVDYDFVKRKGAIHENRWFKIYLKDLCSRILLFCSLIPL